jgi:hypothetical protein
VPVQECPQRVHDEQCGRDTDAEDEDPDGAGTATGYSPDGRHGNDDGRDDRHGQRADDDHGTDPDEGSTTGKVSLDASLEGYEQYGRDSDARDEQGGGSPPGYSHGYGRGGRPTMPTPYPSAVPMNVANDIATHGVTRSGTGQ